MSRAGAYILRRVRQSEEVFFVTLLGVMVISGMLADVINLPGIVGAFLAGLSVNAAVQDHPAREKLEFFGKALFIPSFFIVTGFLIAPVAFVMVVFDNFPLVAGMIVALLVGKWIAAALVGRAYGYGRSERLTMWGSHIASSSRNARGDTSRLRYDERSGSATAGRQDAERGAGAVAHHIHPWSDPDGAICHGYTGATHSRRQCSLTGSA